MPPLKDMSTDRGNPFSTLPLGKLLGGRYEILELLDEGDRGAIYLAKDNRFQAATRLCAVKEMVPLALNPAARSAAMEEFTRGVNILAVLSHPAIPQVYDYFTEGRRSYLVLEHIEGRDLESILKEKGSGLPESQVLPWAIQICELLSYLHGQDPPIVFRDLKPSNILVREEGQIVLVGSSIVEAFEPGKMGKILGTPGYAAPEQYQGIAEPASDIYALGATMHHLLTGSDPRVEPPFTFHERPIRELNPSVSPEVEAIVKRALEYKREDRYSSAQEMRRALLAVTGRGETLPTPSAAPGVVSPLWSFGCDDEVRSSPAVAGETLFIGSYDGYLYALRIATGDLLWKYPTQGGIASSPCVVDDLVFFGSEDRLFYALHTRTGRIEWSCPTGGRIRSSPRWEYEHLFFGSDDGYFYALRARTGRMVWRFNVEAPIHSSPAIYRGTIFFGAEDGHIYALDAPSGEVRWKHLTGKGVASSPTVEGELVFVGSRDRYIYALSMETGSPVWRCRTEGSVISSPFVAGGVLYIGSGDHKLYALNSKTGRIKWSYSTEGAITSSPRLAQGAVYFGSVDGHTYSLDAQTGELRWRFQTGGPVPGSPAIHKGVVYIGSCDQILYALPA